MGLAWSYRSVRWSSMLSATSSQTDANSSSSFFTKGSSACSASFRYMAAWPRRESGQSCLPNTVPLRWETSQSIVGFLERRILEADVCSQSANTTKLNFNSRCRRRAELQTRDCAIFPVSCSPSSACSTGRLSRAVVTIADYLSARPDVHSGLLAEVERHPARVRFPPQRTLPRPA